MYKIIDLDIDGTLTGDTRIEEIALVEMPAIEQNFIYFSSQKSFIVPTNISKNACKARKYKEENGSSCGTNVGWTRSSQLCDRQPISLDTVKRMYSYLSRHKVDLESSKSYDDGCGFLMYDAWGGTEALDWAERILSKEEGFDYTPTLPSYVQYPKKGPKKPCKPNPKTGMWDCEDKDMKIKPVLFVERNAGESKQDYVNRCTEYLIKNEGYSPDQAYAICNSKSEEFAIGQKVSFDYDDTITTHRGRGLVLHELQSGSIVYIISARHNKQSMLPLAKELGIPASRVFAEGSNVKKLRKIKELRIDKHYDNNEDVINQLGRIGVQFNCPCLDEKVEMGMKIAVVPNPCWGGYVPYGTLPDGRPLCRKDEDMAIEPNPCWEGYEPIGLKDDGSPNCVPMKASAQQINPSPVSVADHITKELEDMVNHFNHQYAPDLGYGVTLDMLLEVYHRGVDDYYQDQSPEVIDPEAWGIQRVEQFIQMMITGSPTDPNYTEDYDILPPEHPLSVASPDAFRVVKEINGVPVFSTPEEAIMYGEHVMGCNQYKVYRDEEGNELYLACQINPEPQPHSHDFGVDEYSEEEKEAAKLLYWLKENHREKFEAVLSGMNGKTEAEVKAMNHKKPTIYFKYSRVLDGFPDREFCDSIENRYFRRLEIDLLRDTNREFGHEKQPYSKWLYKGGPNCVHAWQKFLVQGDVIADQGMASGQAGIPPKQMPNNGYYSEETKRKSEVAYIISQQNMSQQFFSDENKEKRMLYGPLMIPHILIPRLDEETNEKYFVRFTPQSIEKMQQLYMIEKRMDKTNYEHSKIKVPSVVMVESWIVAGENDKAYQLGFKREDIPDGTWMGGFKVMETPEGDYIWNEFIKTGKVKSFSVEGDFLLKFSRQKTDEYLLEEIINILNKINN